MSEIARDQLADVRDKTKPTSFKNDTRLAESITDQVSVRQCHDQKVAKGSSRLKCNANPSASTGLEKTLCKYSDVCLNVAPFIYIIIADCYNFVN